jgi:hypothetical protein
VKNLNFVGESHLHLKDLDLQNLDPVFRRATPSMVLATLGCQNLLQSIPDIPRDQISFLMGCHFGEIGSTLDFLKTYQETQVPRPILFQNSLHNSTLGFTTIQLGLTGPAMTVSTGKKTVQSVLDLSENMLLISDFTILCFVDSVPSAVAPFYQPLLSDFDIYQDQSACFLVCTDEALQKSQLKRLNPTWGGF